MVVLSLGANATIGGRRISLPSYWLWRVFPPYRFIRVPARFNLFAAVVAALLAAGGLRGLLRSLRSGWGRAGVALCLGTLSVADLAMVPFGTPSPIPAVPAIYAELFRARPGSTVLEVPQYRSDGSLLNAVCGYWQASHRGRTSAGYSGLPNLAYDNLIYRTSPFQDERLADPAYLVAGPTIARLDLLRDVDFDAYTWLYLKYHGFSYVVLHRNGLGGDPGHLARLCERLRPGLIYEDPSLAVYDRECLAPPAGLTVLLASGWRQRAGGGHALSCAVGAEARIAAYQPRPGGKVRLTLTASAFREPRRVRLVTGGIEVASWRLDPDRLRTLTSPRFCLPGGIQELALVSDGVARPVHNREMASEGDRTPYSLRVSEVGLVAADE
jgi:hypothetical protein